VTASVGIVAGGQLVEARGHQAPTNAASLGKLVTGHLALELIDDLDEPIHGAITPRHILSHTTGLPNWREPGQALTPRRPPGVRWGYSGEGFLLLQKELERRMGQPIDDIAAARVFVPLDMVDTRFDDPEPGYHGHRPLLTTGADFGRFLAHALTIDDERWQPQWRIDDELAWGAGWGLELGPPVWGWQWGLSPGVSHFVIGCPGTGDGVVVLTDDPEGRAYYRDVVEQLYPGDHASLRVERNETWLELNR
jgi:CubicO group peptidase (beta-lactamase class C family)